jgi:hypothetical protein
MAADHLDSIIERCLQAVLQQMRVFGQHERWPQQMPIEHVLGLRAPWRMKPHPSTQPISAYLLAFGTQLRRKLRLDLLATYFSDAATERWVANRHTAV